MINNFNRRNRKEDLKLLCIIIASFILFAWICTPPGNKFAQILFYGNYAQHFIAKLTKPKEELNEYLFHRNNAIYLAWMDSKKMSLKEMNLAIAKAPNYIPDTELSKLYLERAELNLFFREYRHALNDFLRIKNPNIIEQFKIALLYKQIGKKKKALYYCNNILNTDSNAYVGYACYADLYASIGRFDISTKVYDILINKIQNRAQFYKDRAYYKNLDGDTMGAEEDLAKSKELSSFILNSPSIVDQTLKPTR